jgi:hypothetical protein
MTMALATGDLLLRVKTAKDVTVARITVLQP